VNVFVGISAGYSSSIFQIDPRSNSVIAQQWACGPNPSAMAMSGRDLVVLDGYRNNIRRYDNDLREGSEVIPMPGPAGKGVFVRQDSLTLLQPVLQVVQPLDMQLNLRLTRRDLLQPLLWHPIIDIGQIIIPVLLPKRYAVLITGDRAESGFGEFWSDTCWMYKTLRAAGYPASDIFVLYGDGVDYPSANPFYRTPGETVTDFAATNANVYRVFDGLKNGDAAAGIPKMKSTDSLFVWTFDHGSGPEPPGHALLCLRDGAMTDTNFSARLNAIPYAKRAIFMQQCFAGGFSDELSNANTFFSSAARGSEVAHEADGEKEAYGAVWYRHGEYNYYITSALSGSTPAPGAAGVNADIGVVNGHVSALEAHNWYATHENQPEVPVKTGDAVGNLFTIK